MSYDRMTLLEERDRLRAERDALAADLETTRRALRLIRDGRCSCGYRFKWTGMQTRCENCGQHRGSVPPYVPEIARAALAGVVSDGQTAR